MADPTTSIIKLGSWLAQAIGDSRLLFGNFRTEQMGLNLPDAVVQAAPVAAALREAEAAATKVKTAGEDLEGAAGSGQELDIIAAFVELGLALTLFYMALDKLVTAVRASVTPATVPDPTARTAAEQFADDLAKILSELTLATAITDRAPQIGLIMRLLGLVDWYRVSADPANPISNDYILRRLALNRAKDLFNNPEEHYKQTLGWGAPTFDPIDLFRLWRSFWTDEYDVEVGIDAGDPFLRHGGFRMIRDRTTNPPSLGLTFTATLEEKLETRRDLNENWGANVSSIMTMMGVLAGRLKPPFSLELLPPPAATITGELRTFLDRNPAARPFDIIGGIGILSLIADNLTVGIGLKATADLVGGTFTINPLAYVNLDRLTLKVGSSDADSFIGSLLASAEIEGQFDLGLEWQADTGLRVKASGGIQVALPIHKQLGPIEFETIYLALRILPDGTLSHEVSTAIIGLLGPLTATVDRMGVTLDARFAEGTDAKFGPFDLDLKFKPPNGIGLAVNAGAVSGGGYVYLDYEKGEYAGAIELTISGFLSLKAIGLINTKLPGGQPGFALLIIITAEFSPGFQLGFGFSLIGVGGLLGLNRGVLIDPLAQGVRTGAVNSILFPTNIVENMPKILSDLKAIFPIEQGTFVVGPMAKIGWGTPTLVSIALGVIIEIPGGDVVILGRLGVALPTEEAKTLLLQVSFIGVLEFSKRRLWFFATLFESRILFIPLEGEMGLLMDYSDKPNFVLSVGGFHPRFTAPPLPFPSPARIALSLVNESYARVRAETYFAVTSNSVQIGCRIEAFFGFDSLSVDGHFSFDALLRFSPFYLIIELSAGFSVKVFGMGLFHVQLRGSLEGPTPWHIQGSAEIGFLFFSVSVDVDVTFGERRAETLPPIVVFPQMKAEFEKLESWRATLPASGQLFVSLRELGSADALVLHPVGTLQISQRFAPVNLPLERIGNQRPWDVNRITVGVQSSGLAVKGPTKEKFASAQYRDMSDADKLSAPAYEPLDSGVELGADGKPWATGPAAQRNVRYELIVIDHAADPASDPVTIPFFVLPNRLFDHFRGGASVSKAAASLANEKKKQPFAAKVGVGDEQYTVAWQADNRAYSGSATFGSYAQAQAHLADAISADPSLTETIHVIPKVEVNQAA
jgi:hypothetical protein